MIVLNNQMLQLNLETNGFTAADGFNELALPSRVSNESVDFSRGAVHVSYLILTTNDQLIGRGGEKHPINLALIEHHSKTQYIFDSVHNCQT